MSDPVAPETTDPVAPIAWLKLYHTCGVDVRISLPIRGPKELLADVQAFIGAMAALSGGSTDA